MNIVILSSNWSPQDLESIYADNKGGFNGPLLFVDADDLPALLVKLGIYKSKTQARNANRSGEILPGYTELKASKLYKLYIWNPSNLTDS